VSFLDNYEDVAARIQRFWATYPTGKIHTSIMDVNLEKGYVLVECRIYRNYEDQEPAGIDYAFGNVNTYNVQMKKWFIEDTCTSAIGRCAGLVLGTDKRPTVQNMQQVEQIDSHIVQDSAVAYDYWNTKFGEVPSFQTREAAEEAGMPTLGTAIDEIKGTLGGVQVAAAPICAHGHMIFKEGISAKNNKAWGGYMCVEKVKAKQCPPSWYVLTSDGQWKPQV
jgi:hypothetical protein